MEIALPIISIIVSIIAIVVSYYSFRKSHKVSTMPVLIFSRRSEKIWQIQNVGQGPAVSLTVGYKHDDGKWGSIVRCYPIAAGASIELPWINQAIELGATYTDINGNTYSSICRSSVNQVYKNNRFPDWKVGLDEYGMREMRSRYKNMF